MRSGRWSASRGEALPALLADERDPLPARAGGPAGGAAARLVDHEYRRGGRRTSTTLAFEPLAGRSRVEVTERRSKQEFAESRCEAAGRGVLP